MEGRGRLWKAWKAMEDCGRLWQAVEGRGRPWQAVAVTGCGKPWKSMGGCGRLGLSFLSINEGTEILEVH